MITSLNIIEQSPILQIKSVFSKDECAEISKQILAYKDATTKNKDAVMMLNANDGCWMGRPQENNGFDAVITNLLITKLLAACKEYSNVLTKPLNITNLNTDYLDKTAWHVSAWCNVNDPDTENFMHSHPGNFMSGVVYFQAEGTGGLEFVPNNYLYKLTHPAWPYHGISVYEPSDGDILMFPSYLLHRIRRNTSNKQRISMAFDAMLAEKIV
jgi:hypothetical protein